MVWVPYTLKKRDVISLNKSSDPVIDETVRTEGLDFKLIRAHIGTGGAASCYARAEKAWFCDESHGGCQPCIRYCYKEVIDRLSCVSKLGSYLLAFDEAMFFGSESIAMLSNVVST